MKPCYLFLGAPGSGKGTQAAKLVSQTGVKSVSTGDLIRAELKNKTDIGQKCQPYLDTGKLVPDEIIVEMFKKWVFENNPENGFISDGFPRSVTQARHFDQLIESELGYRVTVIFFDVSLDIVKKRILGRLICPNCGNIQNRFFDPPKKEGHCDECGTAFDVRKDDTEDVIESRFHTYQESTEPLLDHYKGRIHRIDASKSPEIIFQELVTIVDK